MNQFLPQSTLVLGVQLGVGLQRQWGYTERGDRVGGFTVLQGTTITWVEVDINN